MFLNRLFKRRVIFVEVPTLKSLSRVDPELAEALRALPHNPGFAWLISKLDLTAQYLNAQLKIPHKDLREYDVLQLGLVWCGWLQQQIAEATSRPPRKLRDPEAEEEELFKQLSAQLERIGSDPTAVDTP